MQRAAAVAAQATRLVHVRRDVQEALGTEEVAIMGLWHAARQPQGIIQRRNRINSSELSVLRATLGPKPQPDGERFKSRGLACAVLSNEEGHVRVEVDIAGLSYRRNTERIRVKSNSAPGRSEALSKYGLVRRDMGLSDLPAPWSHGPSPPITAHHRPSPSITAPSTGA